jgi:hypothetical protein
MLAMVLTQKFSIRLSIRLPHAILFGVALLSLLLAFDSSNLQAQESDETSSSAVTVDHPDIETLFSQLDSPSFKDREAATEALIELGPEILKPLTVHFFNSSSEAGWRIHRILEGIGKNGNESDFLRSIAIIQLLYGAQDVQSQRRLAELQFQWKVTRRREAAQKLKQDGFKFVSAGGATSRELAAEKVRIAMMVRAAAGRDLGGIRIATGPDPVEKPALPAPDRWENPRENRQQSILKIEKIIASDSSVNRKTVEGLLPPEFHVSLPPGTLEVPESWEADEESLDLIADLSTLSNLKFRRQKIDASLQEFISNQSALSGLEFADCEFDDDSSDLKLPKSISSLRFEGSLPPPESFALLAQVATLKLSKIKLDEDTATAISRCKIQVLDLEEVEFTRESIRELVNVRGLFRVTISLCKFKLDWLEDIRKKNPNLISASPKAFLGVQGPVDIRGRNLTGCQISQVVPDTAAAKAGLQSLDIVTAMDGTKISRFEDLRLMISQKRPGESMDLEVRRGDRKLNLTVQLGTMGESIR